MRKALLQLHLAVLLAGFTGILGVFIGLNELLLVFYRMIFAFAIGLGYEMATTKVKWLSPMQHKRLFLVGALIALHWVCFYGSIKYANVSVALVCFSLCGFFAALLEPVINKTKMNWVELGLGCLAVAGIYIIFDFHPQYAVGIGFGVVSAFLAALFPIYNKQLLNKYQPGLLIRYQMITGAAILLLILPAYLHYFPAAYYVPTAKDMGWLLFLAGICTVFTFYLQFFALKRLSAFTLIMAYNLEPVYGILLAFWFNNESNLLDSHFYWGTALMVLSLVIQMALMVAGKKRTSLSTGNGK